MAQLLRPLIDEQLSMVFYDLTIIQAEGLSQQGGDVRKFGLSKQGMVMRQHVPSVVQLADGLPIFQDSCRRRRIDSSELLLVLTCCLT